MMQVFIVRRLLGHNGSRSSGSLEANVNCREPCSCSRTVSTLRVVRICRSYMPPMWLPLIGLKIQSVPSWCNLLLICSLSISLTACCNSVLAPTKFVPLSVRISWIGPWRAINRLRAWIKESVSRELAVSICTALLSKHVKRHPYRFSSFRPSLITYGPK